MVVATVVKEFDDTVNYFKTSKYLNIGVGALAILGFRLSSMGGNMRSGALRVGTFALYSLIVAAMIGWQQMFFFNLKQ